MWGVFTPRVCSAAARRGGGGGREKASVPRMGSERLAQGGRLYWNVLFLTNKQAEGVEERAGSG